MILSFCHIPLPGSGTMTTYARVLTIVIALILLDVIIVIYVNPILFLVGCCLVGLYIHYVLFIY